MSEKNDGGPAFPSQPQLWNVDDNGNVSPVGFYGMSLRDYFAAAALPLVFGTNPNLPGDKAGSAWPDAEELAERQAKYAYLVADAMLTARGQS